MSSPQTLTIVSAAIEQLYRHKSAILTERDKHLRDLSQEGQAQWDKYQDELLCVRDTIYELENLEFGLRFGK